MIENLGNMGDFVGGVGVFITLIYLATQVRQNTNANRLVSFQQIISTSITINVGASTGLIPAIFAKCERGDRLTEEEFARFLMYVWAALTNHWQIFHQYQNGMIEKEVLDTFMARLLGTLNISVARAMWRRRIRNGFPTDFQEYIQQYIEHKA